MRTFFIALSILVLFTTKAQNVFSYHSVQDRPAGAVNINKTLFYIDISDDFCCRQTVNLVCAGDGQILSRKQIAVIINPIYDRFPSISTTADQHIVVSTYNNTGGCDSYSYPKPFIAKLDISGTQKWKVNINQLRVTHLLGLPDSGVVFVADNKMYRLNANGIRTDSLAAGTETIMSIGNYSMDSFVVNYVNGAGPNIRKVSNRLKNGPGILVGTANDNMQVLSDSGLVVLTGGRLIRYNKKFQFVANSDPLLANYYIKSFKVLRDTIYCAGTVTGAAGREIHYFMTTKSFSYLHHGTANFKYCDPGSIAITGNTVNILATGPGPNTYIDFIHLPKTGNIIGTSDIGVTAATVTADYTGAMNVSYINATLTVKNFGNVPVQNFHVNNFGFGPVGWCWHSGFNQEYIHQLASGENVNVVAAFGAWTPTVGSSSTWTAQFCFSTSVPNKSHDIDPDNDQFCVTAMVVGVNEVQAAGRFNIYPNPAGREIHVEGEIPIKSTEIYDLHGHLMFTIEADDRRSVIIRHELVTGMYLMKINTDNVVFTRKIVIQ